MNTHRNKTLKLAVALALATSAGVASAATNEELEARIAQLEAALAELIAEKEAGPQLAQIARPESKWPTLDDDDGTRSTYSFGGYIKVDGMAPTPLRRAVAVARSR